MLTAIPMNNGRFANHFSKAKQFALFDEQGARVDVINNPACGSGCGGKKLLIETFVARQVNRVIVRNIGEKIFERLQAENIDVQRGLIEFNDDISAFQADDLVAIAANDVRTSVNYRRREAQGEHGQHCGCGDHGSVGHVHGLANGAGRGCSGHNHNHSGCGCGGHNGNGRGQQSGCGQKQGCGHKMGSGRGVGAGRGNGFGGNR